jgi:beta-lactamase superfamily II metal-dependent hydrolase
MYNVGFGDAFLVTVADGRERWRMLVDCGVHSQGKARPIEAVVNAIIDDLTAAAGPGQPPSLDVVVATHRHADHISGFACDRWSTVQVGEVWLPFVEDPQDPDAVRIRSSHQLAAEQLSNVYPDRGGRAPLEAMVNAFAINALGNDDSMDRLHSRNGKSFLNEPPVRFLPDVVDDNNVIDTTIRDVRVHVFGPPRDPAQLKVMDPPKNVEWLVRDAHRQSDGLSPLPLFGAAFTTQDPGAALNKQRTQLRLTKTVDVDSLVQAAAILENALNNTSVFMLLDARGTTLLFPGDAQQGAWDHVLDDPVKRDLLSDLAFYKVGHHGSHNATPRRFVDEILGDRKYAMLPWGLVRRWADTIPKKALLDALAEHQTHLVRADAAKKATHVKVEGDLWSEVTFTTT